MPEARKINVAGVPVLGFIAPSGTGKTTLLSHILALLTARGLRIGVIKQARDDFDVDIPGKDSYALRKAGVEKMLLAGESSSALLLEHPDQGAPRLDELLDLLDDNCLDLILVEGFSEAPIPKIELFRETSVARRYSSDPWVVALASSGAWHRPACMPVLDINDRAAIAGFVLAYLEQYRNIDKRSKS